MTDNVPPRHKTGTKLQPTDTKHTSEKHKTTTMRCETCEGEKKTIPKRQKSDMKLDKLDVCRCHIQICWTTKQVNK